MTEEAIDIRKCIEDRLDFLGISPAEGDRRCGFTTPYLRFRVNPNDTVNMNNVGNERLRAIAKGLGIPQILSPDDPWIIVPAYESGINSCGDQITGCRTWISFTRCVTAYLFCDEMVQWVNDARLRDSMGWSEDKVLSFRKMRTPRNDEMRNKHLRGNFQHYSIMREDLFHQVAGVKPSWIGRTIDLLTDEFERTTSLVVVPSKKWEQLNKEVYDATKVICPCTVEVIDDRFAMTVKSCGEEKKVTTAKRQVNHIFNTLAKMLSELRKERVETIELLRKISCGKKSVRR